MTLRTLSTLLLVALAACAGARPRERAAAELRVMTFNIRYGTARDSINSWPLRKQLTFRVIRDYAPQLLGIQEALRFQLDEIQQALPTFERVGVGRDDGKEAGEYSAILYDRNRFELLENGTFWLSETPEVAGSKSWGNNITRIVTWARLRDRDLGKTFYVFNTHWDHESQPSRERSAALLIERIRSRAAASDPVLVMGDFNSGEANPAFKALLATPFDARTGARLYETFRTVHPDATNVGTYHAFKGNSSGDKIDAILASPEWRTLAARIELFHEGDVYPSDHFPVTATLRLR